MCTKFNKDLADGIEVEVELSEILKNLHPTCEIVFNNTSKEIKELRKFDFEVIQDGKKTQIEVKHDRKAPLTGNVAVELICVIHSTADYFCYKIDGNFYLIETNTLLYWIQNKKGRVVRAAEEGKNLIMLIKMNDFLEYSWKVQ
jgi:hypothetical protein